MDVPVCEKYTLTLREAAAYFSIGKNKYYNSRTLNLKKQFEEYLSKHPEIRRRYEKG